MIDITCLADGLDYSWPASRKVFHVIFKLRDKDQRPLARLAWCQLALIEQLVEGGTSYAGQRRGIRYRDSDFVHGGLVRWLNGQCANMR